MEIKNTIITNPSDIANSINNYFAKAAIESNPQSDSPRRSTLITSKPLVNIESFFVTPTDSSEAFNIISSLKLDKSDWPSGIPTLEVDK